MPASKVAGIRILEIKIARNRCRTAVLQWLNWWDE